MRLRKLVLSGFKSFADRTEFDFDRGISCIVGPNGCGKSNVVDAVKWVLGEQSAKSLRGSEMLDVIFNGSATRRPAGMAEVTLVFEDCAALLQPNVPQAPEGHDGVVSIGRRLYRDGTSEYLVNKAPCRLKDIREMFLDTGVGAHAYSVIEQGRVEAFLQASQEERRTIFDEAAGISKYKVRKREALRKLEHVEQNLLRLNVVLGEVEKRLRSIKYQAGKARSYQAHTEQLKELRSLYFLAQYHTLSGQRGQLQRSLDGANDALAAMNARIDQLEVSRSATEVEAVDLERAARELQGKVAAIGAAITTCQERADMQAVRAKELGDHTLAVSARCEELEAKIAAADREIASRRSEQDQLDARAADLAQRLEAVAGEHLAGEKDLARLRASLEDEKAGTIDLMRRTALLHNEIHASVARREGLHGQRQRLSGRAQEVDDSIRRLLTEQAEFQVKLDQARRVLSDLQERLEQTRHAGQEACDLELSVQRELSDARERRSALAGRIDALKEMQDRMEGLAGSTRRILEARREGRLQFIRGMLGEFVETDMADAPIVEAALAGADQLLLAESFDALAAGAGEMRELLGPGGSVEAMCMDRLADLPGDRAASSPDEPGVPGSVRVIDLVRFEPRLAPVMKSLLGRTLVAPTLAAARDMAGTAPAGFRFVTHAGEVLEADGRVRIGAAGKASGVIVRRSEMAQLQGDLADLDGRIVGLQDRCRAAHDQREHLDELQHSLRTAIYEASTERVEAEGRLTQAGDQIASLQREQPLLADDLRSLAGEIEAAVKAEHEARDKAAELERLNAQRQEEIRRLDERIAAAAQRQSELNGRMTELKVQMAAADEKRQSVAQAIAALSRQREQMAREVEAGRNEIELGRKRRQDAEAAIQAARGEVERLYVQQEALNREERDLEESRKGLREKLEQIRSQLADHRKRQEQAGAEVNDLKVRLGEADVRIEDLIARASDEMGMSLLELYKTYRHDDSRDWSAVEAQIKDLREKIERLGSVNLDAIAEQDELEQRRKFLAEQLADVNSSKNQLEELIRRINRESRELFAATFQVVRRNFQELFRKLFGGGRADVLLVDEEDVLESPIEIVARPPGKELRSLSLLSGGEKTMTALALLFSIFRSKPGPFCLLDEVDAALDETNTERFNRLVAEFVSASQIVMISHAKRTMSSANVLYGVTMQEPGVSTRISVRFEDAGEKLDRRLQPAGA